MKTITLRNGVVVDQTLYTLTQEALTQLRDQEAGTYRELLTLCRNPHHPLASGVAAKLFGRGFITRNKAGGWNLDSKIRDIAKHCDRLNA